MDPVQLLDRAPRWVRRAALATAQGRGPIGALLDPVLHPMRGARPPALPPTGEAPIRLLIGPANEVEQGYQWARAAAREIPGVDAVAMMGFDPGGYAVRADLRVPEPVYLRSATWHREFEAWLTSRTHVIVESGLPLLGRAYGSDAFAEIDALTRAGVRVAMMFHGSDIRPPELHRSGSEWSPFHDSRVPSAVIADRVRRNASEVARRDLPVFVSTPDLLRYAPGAVWCPVVIDPADWERPGPPAARRAVPRVVHAPSSTLIKGTDRIEPIVRRLADEGLIEYRRISGVPYAQMPAAYADADIVLDQFLIGGYGVAACEAFAAGALVVGHVDAQTRDTVRAATGLDVPVVEATVDGLETVLRRAAADPAAFAGVSASGPGFVRAVHDGRRSAEALAPFLTGSVRD